MKCECFDPKCPVKHEHEQCINEEAEQLVRIDMQLEPIYMCDECATDALESGLFS